MRVPGDATPAGDGAMTPPGGDAAITPPGGDAAITPAGGDVAITPAGGDVKLAWAGPAQTAAALALLPELAQAAADAPAGAPTPLPPRLAVAHRAGAPAELVGAAGFLPVVHERPTPGFRGQVRVLPHWRRRGLGRALLRRIADEVRAWDMPHLRAWQAEPEDEAGAFLRAMGFRSDFTLHHFLIEKTVVAPMCARLVDRLRAGGRVPPGMALLPLHEAPRGAVVQLHAAEFSAGHEAAAAMLARELADPLVRALSFALWDGTVLAGYLLAGRHDGLPQVRFWASAPQLRGGWAAALLLDAFVRAGVDAGGDRAHYSCNANARAPLNVARRCGAQELPRTHGWVLDLSGRVAGS
jgi:GNAT superfamily N-acetyltransferase